MRQILLKISYRGTRYHGFQVQQNAVSVASVLQDAVQSIFGERIPVKGCSRTDAGVHANAFALTLYTESKISCEALVRAMNVHLPDDVAVLYCQEVSQTFHPRYSCVGKRYIYRIWNTPVKNPFYADLALHIPYLLDERIMNEGAHQFIGMHDFKSFCSAGGKIEDTVRNITDAFVVRRGEFVEFSITGNGFLYNMVRIITGTLLEISRGKILPENIPRIIEACDRKAAGPTAPSHGLYLDAVFYADGIEL